MGDSSMITCTGNGIPGSAFVCGRGSPLSDRDTIIARVLASVATESVFPMNTHGYDEEQAGGAVNAPQGQRPHNPNSFSFLIY